MKLVLTAMLLSFPLFLLSQNCNAYLYQGDTCQYEACIIAEKRAGKYQFSRPYQEALDEGIARCDRFSHAYRHKSVAYLKSGDFLNWKKLMDKAVALDPAEHLGYRGWCRYQFFRDYRGAIADIERLDSLVTYDIGHSVNSDYHLNVAKAICYKAIGQKEKALQILRKQLQEEDHLVGIYDYLHLGVLLMELGRDAEALDAFSRQRTQNDLAEIYYYEGIIAAKTNREKAITLWQKAKDMYLENKRMYDHYTYPYDQVYLAQIEARMAGKE